MSKRNSVVIQKLGTPKQWDVKLDGSAADANEAFQMAESYFEAKPYMKGGQFLHVRMVGGAYRVVYT